MDTSSNAGHRRRPHQAPERRLAAKNLGRLFGVSRGSSKALSWQEHRHAVLEMTKGYARERGGDRARNTRQPDIGSTTFILTLAGVRNGRTGKSVIGQRCKVWPKKRSHPKTAPSLRPGRLGG